MDKLIEYYNELTNNDFNEEELMVELDSLNSLKRFCKWLVDNDKIDLIKLRAKMYRVFEFRWEEYATYENELLMLLSIQDNPIEFLVSILK